MTKSAPQGLTHMDIFITYGPSENVDLNTESTLSDYFFCGMKTRAPKLIMNISFHTCELPCSRLDGGATLHFHRHIYLHVAYNTLATMSISFPDKLLGAQDLSSAVGTSGLTF